MRNAPATPLRGRDSLFFPAFDACPGCSGAMRSRSLTDLTVFVCVACGSWWHVQLGVVYRLAGSEPAGTPS